MKVASLVAALAAAMFGMISSALLWKAGIPFANPSWTKERPEELTFANRAKQFQRAGLVFLAAAFIASAAAAIFDFFS